VEFEECSKWRFPQRRDNRLVAPAPIAAGKLEPRLAWLPVAGETKHRQNVTCRGRFQPKMQKPHSQQVIKEWGSDAWSQIKTEKDQAQPYQRQNVGEGSSPKCKRPRLQQFCRLSVEARATGHLIGRSGTRDDTPIREWCNPSVLLPI